MEFKGHNGPVAWAAFSPDGDRIVTASWDGTARIWAADDTDPLAVLECHEGPVWMATFSADGTRVVTASSDGTARVWNAEDGVTSAVLEGHDAVVCSARFGPDAKKVITGSWDGTGRVWSADGSGTSIELSHRDHVCSAGFTSGDQQATTISSDGERRLWVLNWDAGVATAVRTWAAASRVYSKTEAPAGSRLIGGLFDRFLPRRSFKPYEDLDARSLLWQTPFCHGPERRMELLGEAKDLAQKQYARCRELTELCSTQPYEARHERVQAEFGS